MSPDQADGVLRLLERIADALDRVADTKEETRDLLKAAPKGWLGLRDAAKAEPVHEIVKKSRAPECECGLRMIAWNGCWKCLGCKKEKPRE